MNEIESGPAESWLSSNGIPVTFDGGHAPLVEHSGLSSDSRALRNVYEGSGHVLLRDFVPREAAASVRQRYLELLQVHRGELPAHGIAGHPAHTIVREPLFEALVQHPKLRDLAETLLGGPVVPLKRAILRHFTRGSGRASRAHRDQAYFAGPSDQIVTFWIPLVDVPLRGGGLVILEDSNGIELEPHKRALALTRDRFEDERPISPNLDLVSRVTRRRWLRANYRSGDLVALSTRVIHASLDCDVGDRLSIDTRFALASAPIDPRWMANHWSGDDGL